MCIHEAAPVGDGDPEILVPSKSDGEMAKEVSMAMIFAGLRALGDWKYRETAGQDVHKGDLVTSIYVAMRRQA